MALPSCWQARTRRRISQFQQPLVGQTAQQRAGIREDLLPRCGIRVRAGIADIAEGCLTGATLDDLDCDVVGLEDALRRKQHPAALRLVVDETHAPRQSRARLEAPGAGWVRA